MHKYHHKRGKVFAATKPLGACLRWQRQHRVELQTNGYLPLDDHDSSRQHSRVQEEIKELRNRARHCSHVQGLSQFRQQEHEYRKSQPYQGWFRARPSPTRTLVACLASHASSLYHMRKLPFRGCSEQVRDSRCLPSQIAHVLKPAKMSLLSGVAKLRQVLRSIRPRVAQQPPRMILWFPNQGSE